MGVEPAGTSATEALHEETIHAEEPSGEYRSNWTDLRGVAFSQGWLDVRGVRIRYLRSGDAEAPTVVMLPGTGGHAETFVANLGPLGEAFQCFAIDVPGTGYSDKPDALYDAITHADFLQDFAATIRVTRIHLVGCSVGSWTSLRCAIAHPELVERLILVSPAGGPLPEPDDPWYDAWMAPPAMPEMEDRRKIAKEPTWERSEAILRALIPDRRRLTDDIIAARLDVNRQAGAAQAAERVNWWTDHELRIRNSFTREELRSVRQPVLGVCEVNDRLLPMTQAMFRCLSNGRLVRVDGVGHWPHYEAPHQFNDLALEFLRAETVAD
jgi:2-hydroxy-6-oxonona-2,4-dienedioate hydrolase